MLSDGTIFKLLSEGRIGIDPWPAVEAFQPASVDLRLGCEFLPVSAVHQTVVKPDGVYTLGPGDCVLACTQERIRVPADVVARVEGKSSWGRRFLMVHSTAGFIDPGFEGEITLELTNLSNTWLPLQAGAYIAQISFEQLDQPARRPYGTDGLNSRYQHQHGVTAART